MMPGSQRGTELVTEKLPCCIIDIVYIYIDIVYIYIDIAGGLCERRLAVEWLLSVVKWLCIFLKEKVEDPDRIHGIV